MTLKSPVGSCHYVFIYLFIYLVIWQSFDFFYMFFISNKKLCDVNIVMFLPRSTFILRSLGFKFVWENDQIERN